MIIKENTSNIKANNIDKTGLGFRQEDMAHIVSLLSTNLYSEPISSTVRELVSNAVDSVKEAGTNDPIIVALYEKRDKIRFKIRDFGTGLSKENFENLYKNFGASSKRDSNDYIGSFGIGRLSPLSYTDSVDITSYYEGTRYDYTLVKDGLKIDFYHMNETKTDKKNGLEVSIILKNREDYWAFRRAIFTQVLFFDNVLIKDDIFNNPEARRIAGSVNSYNFNEEIVKTKTKYYEIVKTKLHTSISNSRYEDPVDFVFLIGNVAYKMPEEYKNKITKTYYVERDDFSEKYVFGIKIDIGEVNVTPNREQIIYTKETEKLVQDKVDKILEIFNENIRKVFDKEYDFNSLLEFLKTENIGFSIGGLKFKTRNSSIFENEKIKYRLNSKECEKYTIKELKNLFKVVVKTRGIYYSRQRYRLGDSGILSRNLKNNYEAVDLTKSEYFIKNLSDLSPKTKHYIHNEAYTLPHFNSAGILKYSSIVNLRKVYREAYKEYLSKNFRIKDKTKRKKLVKSIYGTIFNKKNFIEIDNDFVPKSYDKTYKKYLENRKLQNSISKKITDTLCFKRCRTSDRYGIDIVTDNEHIKMEEIEKKLSTFAFYINENDTEKMLLFNKLAKKFLNMNSNIAFFKVSNSVYKKLSSEDSEVFIDFEEVFEKSDNKHVILFQHFIYLVYCYENDVQTLYNYINYNSQGKAAEMFLDLRDNILDQLFGEDYFSSVYNNLNEQFSSNQPIKKILDDNKDTYMKDFIKIVDKEFKDFLESLKTEFDFLSFVKGTERDLKRSDTIEMQKIFIEILDLDIDTLIKIKNKQKNGN